MTAETTRALHADLAICDVATPGPWLVDEGVANQIRQPNGSKRRRITTPPDADGISDAKFIAEAREGWPEAIRRAILAEAEVKRLRETLMDVYQKARNDVARWDGGQCVGVQVFSDRVFARRLVRDLESKILTEVCE
ncbi:hypothetical protein [Paenibacillus apiarius]|uniref:hypothetical protein n=1 Tax=Paenibacillus apiarius TaxID=46240 RepID=UPI003B3B5996